MIDGCTIKLCMWSRIQWCHLAYGREINLTWHDSPRDGSIKIYWTTFMYLIVIRHTRTQQGSSHNPIQTPNLELVS